MITDNETNELDVGLASRDLLNERDKTSTESDFETESYHSPWSLGNPCNGFNDKNQSNEIPSCSSKMNDSASDNDTMMLTLYDRFSVVKIELLLSEHSEIDSM